MADNATITASAPGSLMLLGEHAVLHGHHALVCAINQRITVHLRPISETIVRIKSSLGNYETELNELADHAEFRFVLQAIRQHVESISTGFELEIESDFPPDIGFGSSAAVTVATHAALMRWIHNDGPKNRDLFMQALESVHAVQGRGSGADLAASVFGGIVAYTTDPEFLPFIISMPLVAVYCGYKTPTTEVIRTVESLRNKNPKKYDRIFSEMNTSVAEALACLSSKDLFSFGKILNRNQQLMDEMGVNTPELETIVSRLQQEAGIYGAKISGSGLGDCAVGIGSAKLDELKYTTYDLEVTPIGCSYHDDK